jgi:hypothetical protein
MHESYAGKVLKALLWRSKSQVFIISRSLYNAARSLVSEMQIVMKGDKIIDREAKCSTAGSIKRYRVCRINSQN